MVSIPNSFTSSTVIKSADINTNFQTLGSAITPTFVFTQVGTLVTGTNLTPVLIAHGTWTISKVYAYVKTAPTGANLVIDLNKNGTSIWNVTQGNRISIVAGAQTGSQTSFDTTSLSDGDILSLDLDTVGSTVPGSDLTVEIKTT